MSFGEEAIAAAESVFTRVGRDVLIIERRPQSLVLTPTASETFPITLYGQGDELMIAADRWHAHYDEVQQAIFGIWWLFTPFYRLVQEFKGALLAATWLEAYEAEGWLPSDPVFFLNPEHPESWSLTQSERCVRRYWQQRVLPPPVGVEEAFPGILLTSGLPPDSRIGLRSESSTELIGHTLQ